MKIFTKFKSIIPSYPHYVQNVFSGTNHWEEIKTVLFSLFSNTDVSEGAHNSVYEEVIKKKLTSQNAYTFASGRMGFYTILKTLNIQDGDEIIIPAYTCVVVPNAILYAGGTPIYCDINEEDYNIDTTKIEALITDKTKALYAQHTFGKMCDVRAIQQLAQKYDLPVIEDVALSLGATLNGQYAGTFGDFGYYSTDRTKMINTALGGIVLVNNQKYVDTFEKQYEAVPYLSAKISKKIARTFLIDLLFFHPWLYWLGSAINPIFRKIGFNQYFLDERKHQLKEIKQYPYPARFSNILAPIGISQFEDLNNNIAHRRKLAGYYNKILQIYEDDYIQNSAHVFLRYSFLIKNRDYWEKRFASKIDLSIWFKTVAVGKEDDFDEIGYTVGSCTTAEFISQHIFNLPTHYRIDPKKFESLLVELYNSGDIIDLKSV